MPAGSVNRMTVLRHIDDCYITIPNGTFTNGKKTTRRQSKPETGNSILGTRPLFGKSIDVQQFEFSGNELGVSVLTFDALAIAVLS